MLITFDRTDFPLVVVEDAAVEIHLLPVTKVQFEAFVAEQTPVDERRYEQMLALNPAAQPDTFTAAERERLFVSGVLPEEALAFARWLGDGFDLPTVTEWRAVMAALRREPPPRQRSLVDVLRPPARTIIEKFKADLHIRSVLDLSLLREGLVEWVRQGDALMGLGSPRPEFHPNLWDPLVNVIEPIHLDERVRYFGFRLARRGEWYLADKENTRSVF